jgi:hypothetical protein
MRDEKIVAAIMTISYILCPGSFNDHVFDKIRTVLVPYEISRFAYPSDALLKIFEDDLLHDVGLADRYCVSEW